MNYLISILTAVFLFIQPTICSADSWLSPKLISSISENGRYVVRVTPSAFDNEAALSGASKDNAKAIWYRFDGNIYEHLNSKRLNNPVNPVAILVSDRGILVTLDNWHSMGFGNVVSIYSQYGLLIAEYELNDLYDLETVSEFKKSMSSIWWRCESPNAGYIENNSNILKVTDSLGGLLSFDLFSGDFEYEPDISRHSAMNNEC